MAEKDRDVVASGTVKAGYEGATATPDPQAWPECSTCSTPYVLRRAMQFSPKTGQVTSGWFWSVDCKHKDPRKHPPRVVGPAIDSTDGEGDG